MGYVWLLLRRMSSECCGWCHHKDYLLTQVNLTERTQRSASEHSMVETAATIQTDKHGLVTTLLIVVHISQLFVFVFMLSPLFIYSEVKTVGHSKLNMTLKQTQSCIWLCGP